MREKSRSLLNISVTLNRVVYVSVLFVRWTSTFTLFAIPLSSEEIIERCTTCKNSSGDLSIEKCSYVSNGTSKLWLRKADKIHNSYELFSTDMGSIRTGDTTIKIYSEVKEPVMKTKTNTNFSEEETEGGKGLPSPKSKENLQSPEYVKRTAKLFESVRIVESKTPVKNGLADKKSIEDMSPTDGLSPDTVDGEANKKPSYLGVSCSNSGYRNVINYDSKLREGLHSANTHRESLMLSSSRLRENSPLRRDVEFIYRNGKGGCADRDGTETESFKVTVEKEKTNASKTTTNDISKFLNISTSTKTISTFRNSKDLENNLNNERKSMQNGNASVNLKQILNNKSEIRPYKGRGYSNLGFSPKILKSPEKNCNSFLKSISSFENNSIKWQSDGKSWSDYSKEGHTLTDTTNSIQQRIERLYGPGALAHGFHSPRAKTTEKGNRTLQSEGAADNSYGDSNGKIEISLSSLTKPVTPTSKQSPSSTRLASHGQKGLPKDTKKVVEIFVDETEEKKNETKPVPEVAATNKQSNESQTSDSPTSEKNGLYFLELLKKETDRLELLASFAEKELENGENLPEEINGKLRAAAGKARLLVCQKLNQFEGLCKKNMNEKPSEPFPTTSEDLAGFWDMVMLQIVQVYGIFEEIDELRKNKWKVPVTKNTESTSNLTAAKSSTKATSKKAIAAAPLEKEKSKEKAEAAKKAREETRKKMLEDRRKKMKELKENKITGGEDGVEIFAK